LDIDDWRVSSVGRELRQDRSHSAVHPAMWFGLRRVKSSAMAPQEQAKPSGNPQRTSTSSPLTAANAPW
jgi:hypothetical protein